MQEDVRGRGNTYEQYMPHTNTSVTSSGIPEVQLHRTVEVLNTAKVKTRKKLYEDLCAETDLDLSQTSGLDMPRYLRRSLFIIENL
jgi:hypothetical protein